MDDPIHICIVDIRWPPETFLVRKIQGLAERGFIVEVIVNYDHHAELPSHPNIRLTKPSYLALRKPISSLAGIARYLLRCRPSLQRIRQFWAAASSSADSPLQAARQVVAVLPLLAAKPDLIQFEWIVAADKYRPFFELLNCPVVISCLGSRVNIAPHNPRRKGLKESLRRAFNDAAAVHCVSAAIRDEAVQYGLAPEKAWIIRPAADPNFFVPFKKTKDKGATFNLSSIGRIIWVKGYEYALIALRKLLDSGINVQYTIIGDGPERQRLLYTIEDLCLQGHAHLVGKQSSEQVRNRLQQADAFLHASLSEGISNAVLEAMACGLPVVTTNCGGMQEAVTDGVEGFVVPVRDPHAIAQALARLANDPELRHCMGLSARQRILDQFTHDREIEQFRQMYLSVVCAA